MLLNDSAGSRVLKVGVYGPSGSGKTTLGVTAPEPVILLCERQGWDHIKDAAARLGKPTPPTYLIETIDQFREAVRILRDPDDKAPLKRLNEKHGSKAKLPYDKPQSIVVDSVTEVLKLIVDGIDKQSPRKIASDGLPQVSDRFWGALTTRGDGVFRSIRDLPYHTITLARMIDKEIGEGQDKSRLITPMLSMYKFAEEWMSTCNAVGIAYKERELREKEDDLYHFKVRFTGPAYMKCKTLRPLRDTEVPNVTDWIARWEAGIPDDLQAHPLDGHG